MWNKQGHFTWKTKHTDYDPNKDINELSLNYEDLNLNTGDWPVYLMTNMEPYNIWGPGNSATQEPSSSF
jgi:hypothetical protein